VYVFDSSPEYLLRISPQVDLGLLESDRSISRGKVPRGKELSERNSTGMNKEKMWIQM
jgi:hypothetical protein